MTNDEIMKHLMDIKEDVGIIKGTLLMQKERRGFQHNGVMVIVSAVVSLVVSLFTKTG